MNKKGVDLTLNTIILAVLVVLVLIVVVTFFLGGFGRITETISRVFFPVTSGTDLTIAVQTCEQRCDQAKLLPESLRSNSAFCKIPFNIDKDGNGLVDRINGNDNDKSVELKKYYCFISGDSTQSLGISCQMNDGNQLPC